MKLILLAAAVSLLVAGCSTKKDNNTGIPGADLPELTQEQKSKSSAVGRSISASQAMIENNSNHSGSINDVDKKNEKLTVDQVKLNEKLKKNIDSARCEVTSISKGSASSSNEVETEFKGVFCPISLKSVTKTTTTVQGTSQITSSLVSSQFKVVPSGEMAADFDVVSYNTDVNTNSNVSSGSSNATRINSTTSAKVSANSKTNGFVIIEYTSSNDMSFSFDPSTNISNSTVNTSQTVTETFSDFKAVGYIVGNVVNNATANQSVSYYVNGKPVSVEEFISVFGTTSFK